MDIEDENASAALRAEVDDLRAELKRLRVALEDFIGAAEHCGDGDAPVVIRARAALNFQQKGNK